jgi:hypothetical protein
MAVLVNGADEPERLFGALDGGSFGLVMNGTCS